MEDQTIFSVYPNQDPDVNTSVVVFGEYIDIPGRELLNNEPVTVTSDNGFYCSIERFTESVEIMGIKSVLIYPSSEDFKIVSSEFGKTEEIEAQSLKITIPLEIIDDYFCLVKEGFTNILSEIFIYDGEETVGNDVFFDVEELPQNIKSILDDVFEKKDSYNNWMIEGFQKSPTMKTPEKIDFLSLKLVNDLLMNLKKKDYTVKIYMKKSFSSSQIRISSETGEIIEEPAINGIVTIPLRAFVSLTQKQLGIKHFKESERDRITVINENFIIGKLLHYDEGSNTFIFPTFPILETTDRNDGE